MTGNEPERVGQPTPGHWRLLLLALVGLLGAGVLAGLVLTVRDASESRERAFEAQARDYETMLMARSVDSSVGYATAALVRLAGNGDAERGYAFETAWNAASDAMDRLTTYGSGDRAQHDRVAALGEAVGRYGAALKAIARDAQTHRLKDAAEKLRRLTHTQLRDTISKQADATIAAERVTLTERDVAARSTVQHANLVAATLLVLAVGIILAAIGLGAMMVGALRERAIAHAEAATAQLRAAELEEAVADAIAELRREEQERADAEAKLRQIQKIEAIGQLTGGIAHDFNNMLAVVIGGLELARRQVGEFDPLAARHIDNATEGAQRAAALTRQLLAFARAEPLQPASIEVGALIAGMRDLLDRSLGGGVRVEVRDAGRGWSAWIDPTGLESALLNLAVNARDAMNGRGLLIIGIEGLSLEQGAVGACSAGDYVAIAVTDQGCGMTPDVLERAFEPFFTTKPVGKGTGLGLSQIFGFVRAGGGEIDVRSAPGIGTTVTLYLPRHIAGAVEPVRPRTRATAPNVTALPVAPPAQLTVLVVEDDPRVLGATMGALKELGHRPIACSDPLAAPDLIARAPRIDLIVTDVQMPQQTGPEMIAALLPRHPHFAVLFVTGYAGDSDAAEFAGHVVLRKPYTLAALEAAVADAVMRRYTIAAPAAA